MAAPKQFDGSRRHILDWVESSNFLDTVRQWVKPQDFSVATDAMWMPKGRDHPNESRLFNSTSPFLDPGRKESMWHWWLTHAGNIPNWDLIVQATDPIGPALILIEAKAHAGEFDRKRKPLSGRGDSDMRLKTIENHLQIGRAIAEASNALSSVHKGISISRDRHYQLSNRIAMAWKLASLGIPNTLIFLGFTGDREISRKGDYFADDDHWRGAFDDYLQGCFPRELLEHDISSGPAAFRVLSRSLPVIHQSRPIAERRHARQAAKS